MCKLEKSARVLIPALGHVVADYKYHVSQPCDTQPRPAFLLRVRGGVCSPLERRFQLQWKARHIDSQCMCLTARTPYNGKECVVIAILTAKVVGPGPSLLTPKIVALSVYVYGQAARVCRACATRWLGRQLNF